ncbi:MAG: glyoxalase [Bacteroidota bacterium]
MLRSNKGAKDFKLSREFYQVIGFDEVTISEDMVLFKVNELVSFYLQEYYVKEWADNSMIFLEVNNLDECYAHLQSLNLPDRFPGVRLSVIKTEDWGRECFLHDPSGVLWHIGTFEELSE